MGPFDGTRCDGPSGFGDPSLERGGGQEELLPVGDDAVDRRPGVLRLDVGDRDQAAVAALEMHRVGQRKLGREFLERPFDRGPIGVVLDREGVEVRSRFHAVDGSGPSSTALLVTAASLISGTLVAVSRVTAILGVTALVKRALAVSRDRTP